ncbi:MAG: PLP-dependent aminotransferase family protein [Eubacterium sp.]|nr:PLP-dependent aminotransferase family protein [Eubacterium sp.]
MKKYLAVYRYYQKLIASGELQAGERLPSVRKCAALLSVSMTTVQNAYFELQADGYIIAADRSGYYVAAVQKSIDAVPDTEPKPTVLYDLKSGDADRDSFDLTLWQRYIKSALRQGDRLLSYSDVKGEHDLREALSDYISEKRNVLASPDRIVVGAGVHALLQILCSLLKKERRTVSFPDSSFAQGMALFEDYGYRVTTRNKDADVIYVSPSHMTSYGDVMPLKRRHELVRYSEANGSLVIEDDYDSDFCYTHPTPSLYTLSGGNNVVYMGSFANVLIPGIRISFMVLTKELAALLSQETERFAQTASKTEQIALAAYLRDGHIGKQTRKIRRLYTTKTKLFYEEIRKELPECRAVISDNALQIKLTAPYSGNVTDFEAHGISVQVKEYQSGLLKLAIAPSSVSVEAIPQAVQALKQVLMS